MIEIITELNAETKRKSTYNVAYINITLLKGNMVMVRMSNKFAALSQGEVFTDHDEVMCYLPMSKGECIDMLYQISQLGYMLDCSIF